MKKRRHDMKTEINITETENGRARLTAYIYGEKFENEYGDINLAVIAAEELLEFGSGNDE